MRIIQLLPTISYGDAIGNDTLAIQSIIRDMGFESRIYAEKIDPRLPKGAVIPFKSIPRLKKNDVIIYHGSVGTDLNFKLPELDGRKIMIYHNITPPEFFRPYSAEAEALSTHGLEGMRFLSDKLDYCIADSEFNKKDLRRMGYACPIDVCPICIPFDDYKGEPNRELMRKYQDDGYVNLLFVGRIAPNKKQEDVIRTFYFFHKYFNPKSRLVLVGSWRGMEKYYNRLCGYTEELGLTDSVIFTGHIKFDEILAWYHLSDVFLCMSEHEGFCVPLVEAMYFDVPIVAYDGAAVAETLGGTGVLLDDKNPVNAAGEIDRILKDKSLIQEIQEKQRRRLNDFSYENVSSLLQKLLRSFIEGEKMKTIAFVTPWYGENIPGGAEAELRGLVHHLQAAGIKLEVLTTCVKEFQSDWNINFYPAGRSQCAGIPVRRFPVRKRDVKAFKEVSAKLMKNQPVTKAEEILFQREMVNSPALYKYIRKNKSSYELFVFIPYMFGTTYYGIQECYEKAVMIPCLHDESYAYMQIFKERFPKCAGMIFHSEPEQMLARSIYGVSGKTFLNLGEGIDTDFSGDARRFREKYNIKDPFILYAGRKAAGKKVDELVRYFTVFKRRNPSSLKLVLLGGGAVDIPSADVIDLGFLPVQDKYDAYSAASVFCNPSQFESFSIVIMESWISQVPVLVNGCCEVTKDFVKKAAGGLYYDSYPEFELCLKYFFEHTDIAEQMGRNGRAFVQENFSWPSIVAKYTEYFKMVGSEK